MIRVNNDHVFTEKRLASSILGKGLYLEEVVVRVTPFPVLKKKFPTRFFFAQIPSPPLSLSIETKETATEEK